MIVIEILYLDRKIIGKDKFINKGIYKFFRFVT